MRVEKHRGQFHIFIMVIPCTFPVLVNITEKLKRCFKYTNKMIINLKSIIIFLINGKNPWKQFKIRGFEIGQILYGMNAVTTVRHCGFTENK